jgi:hypothetical protein
LFQFIGWKHITMVHFEQENVLFFSTCCTILGVVFFSFHLTFSKTLKMDFWHKSSLTILVIFQMIVFYIKYLCIHTHLCLFEWKPHPYFFVKSNEWKSWYRIEMAQWIHM